MAETRNYGVDIPYRRILECGESQAVGEALRKIVAIARATGSVAALDTLDVERHRTGSVTVWVKAKPMGSK